jgi:hypothetical protein
MIQILVNEFRRRGICPNVLRVRGVVMYGDARCFNGVVCFLLLLYLLLLLLLLSWISWSLVTMDSLFFLEERNHHNPQFSDCVIKYVFSRQVKL